MKNIAIGFIFLICFCSISAKSTLVFSASEINGGNWTAGDTIVMKNGTWSNQYISFKASGADLKPIVLLAETPGQVILTGSSRLSFSGMFIEVNGLYFKDGTLSGSEVISFRTSSSEFAKNCRVTNTAIVNYNPADNTVDSKWVSLYGENNRVDHCSFENKNNSGTLLVVWLKSGVVPNHIIEYNYFGYRNPNLDQSGSELNGQEIIRIGDSSTSMQTAGVTVLGNFFEKCNGEIEVISNKSCGNLYTNNLFYDCKGMLTLRHGNNCTVEGNYFFGNGISSTGGVRIIGENHKVLNNYFEKLSGTGYRAAICMVRGKENSALNEYFQVKNALVAFNTMVDCSQSFNINYNSSTTCTLPPVGTVIAHNHVYNTNSNNNNITISMANESMDVNWRNNLMNQGKFSNFTYTTSQVITGEDPRMTSSGTSTSMFEPVSGSALSNHTTLEYPEVAVDIRGRLRVTESKLPGASEITGSVSREMPIKTAVGAAFFNNPATGMKSQSEKTGFNAYMENDWLITEVSTSGRLDLFDMTGRSMLQKTLTEGFCTTLLADRGIFILSFNSFNEGRFIKKIIVR